MERGRLVRVNSLFPAQNARTIVAFDLACLAATQQEEAVQPESIEVKQTRFTGD
jgi:hypothetical protein